MISGGQFFDGLKWFEFEAMFYCILGWLLLPFWALAARFRRGKGGVLLVQTAKIGDMICAFPIMDAALAAGERLTVAHDATTAALLRGLPVRLRSISAQEMRGLAGKFRLWRWLWREDFAAAIVLSPSAPWLVTLALAGVPRRLAVAPTPAGRTMRLACTFLTHQMPHDLDRLILSEYKNLLKNLNWDVQLQQQSEDNAARLMSPEILSAGKLYFPEARRVFALGIGAGNRFKALGVENLAALAAFLHDEFAANIILVGSRQEHQDGEEVRQILQSPSWLANAAGDFALHDLPFLLRQAALYLGVDSGISYLANAVGVPVVVLPGPANCFEQRPLGEAVRLVRDEALSCAPCGFVFQTVRTCKTGTRACFQWQHHALKQSIRELIHER